MSDMYDQEELLGNYWDNEIDRAYKYTCKYCKTNRLSWSKKDNKWKLVELDINMNEKIHDCRNK